MNTDTAVSSFDELNPVTGSNISLPKHSKVEARTLACEKSFDDVVPAKLDPEFVTGQPWFGDHHERGADLKVIADVERRLEQSSSCEVCAEHAPGKLHLREFALPVFVVFTGISVDRFGRSAVNGKIRSEEH